jgi:hypothetical protein
MISGASTKSKKLRKSISRTKILCLDRHSKHKIIVPFGAIEEILQG